METPTFAPAPAQCAIFLDGEFYVRRMDVPSLIHDMRMSGRLPSMLCLFVSYGSSTARHHDLTCNADFASFIAKDVIAWLRARHPVLAQGGHLVAGPSLGGLAAAHLTLTQPQVFSHCLSQSGSFWWEDERLARMLDEKQMPASHSRFWISVGSRETKTEVKHAPSGLHQKISQVESCEHFATALAAHHHAVHYSLHAGAHDFQPWAEELPQALDWLLRPA